MGLGLCKVEIALRASRSPHALPQLRLKSLYVGRRSDGLGHVRGYLVTGCWESVG